MASSSGTRPKKTHVIVHENFDYVSIKEAYLQESGYVLLNYHLNKAVIINKSTIESIISNIKGSEKRFILFVGKKYYVTTENGRDILCNVTWSNKAPYKLISVKQILSVEEMFDVIAELHICQPTLSIEEYFNKLSNCHIPRCFIKLVKKACYCSKSHIEQYKVVGEMAIIDLNITLGEWPVFMYIERNTNFILLRPLKTNKPEEVANELLTIFCDFGTPHYMDCKWRSFFEDVINVLKTLPLQFFLPPMYLQSRKHKMILMESKVRNMVNDWMVKSNSTNWVMGTHIIQWMLNTSKVEDMYIRSKIVRGPLESPYHALFGKFPHTDIVQFNCDKSTPKVEREFPLCSQCYGHVYKVYECHFCQAICHFMCCRRVVEETTEMPIIINKCFSCENSMSEEYILGS